MRTKTEHIIYYNSKWEQTPITEHIIYYNSKLQYLYYVIQPFYSIIVNQRWGRKFVNGWGRSYAVTRKKKKEKKNNIIATVPQLEREWVTDCCLKPHQHFFPAISWREQVNFQWDDDEVRFVLEQHAYLALYIASSLRQQSVDRHVATPGHIILISNQSVFALSL